MSKKVSGIGIGMGIMAFLLFLSTGTSVGLAFEPNYDESKVPEYSLPDVLTTLAGEKVTTPEEWFQTRRPEILRMFQEELYGIFPGADCGNLHYVERQRCDNALDGKAVRREGTIYLNWPEQEPKVNLLIYLPKEGKGPFPAFCGLNFSGNQTITTDPGVFLSDNKFGTRVDPNVDPETTRGKKATRWPIEVILSRGYALVTAYYEDLIADGKEQSPLYGIAPLLAEYREKKGFPENVNPAAISAWAWGLSRILDVLETMPEIDAKRVAVFGHSRLGKTALWAGANDPRFALVISNDSGCGGAALYRREFGETFDSMNDGISWWFCENSRKYYGKVPSLPFDQHFLISLIAPRPVYVASAEEDQWADPKGEFLSAYYADPVYRLLGTDGIAGVTEWPPVNTPVGGTIHYHMRTGRHDVTLYDWERYLDFADQYMK